MKKVFVWFLILLVIAAGSFALGRVYHQKRLSLHENQSSCIDNGFLPASFPARNRPFVVFICGYNNGAFLEKTIRSVFSQAYDNYRLIYIDDASNDRSDELARECISQNEFSSRAAFFHNEQKLGFLANLARAVQICKDDEIVVVLRGQDWLAHEWTLSTLNQYFADADLWLAYAQYIEFPSYRMGVSRGYQQTEWQLLRHAPLLANHLPVFYAALFKRIKDSDLLFQGAYMLDGGELALMLPMLEMAQDHFQFIPEVLSISNQRAFGLENRDTSTQCEQYIRSQKPYLPLANLHFEQEENVDPVQETETPS